MSEEFGRVHCGHIPKDTAVVEESAGDIWLQVNEGGRFTAIGLNHDNAAGLVQALVRAFPDLKLPTPPAPALPAMWVGADAFPEDAR